MYRKGAGGGELSLQHIATEWGNKVIGMYAVGKADPGIFDKRRRNLSQVSLCSQFSSELVTSA